ncbi:MAG: phosphatidate cytidylyltransferase [Pseudomonadota bacterium]
MTRAPAKGLRFPDLTVRFVSALVLICVALIDFWHGGLYVTVLVMIATGLMLWEYRRIVCGTVSLREPPLWAMIGAGTVCVLLTGGISLTAGAAALALGVVAVFLTDRARVGWMLPGVLYIALAMAFLVELRRDPVQGFPLVLWLVCVVIAADVGGYFAGRLIGGPKLWPRVSPNKTWAGSLGGLVLALIVGLAFHLSGRISLPMLVGLSAILAAASQLGDLAESALKRKFGRKDSSRLIPGHGGLLDRFDGLLGALWAYGGLSVLGVLEA